MDEGAPESRQLSPDEQQLIAAAREKAFVLYEGKQVPHRSCGIAVAETFNLPTRPYQALRCGGITFEGYCGSLKAGELVLGEYLGDPDPTAPITDPLRRAVTWYQSEIPRRIDKGESPDFLCKNLTRPLGEFRGPARASFCTNLAAEVAELVAEALVRFGGEAGRFSITPPEPRPKPSARPTT